MVSKARVSVRFKRSMRAISPVLSVLMMIAIAVAASLVAYAWIMGYIGVTTNKVGKAVLIQSQAPGFSGIDLYVQNVGQGAVTFDPKGSVYIDDELQVLTAGDFDKTTLNAGETAWIQTHHVWSSSFKAKVVTTDGTFTEKSGHYEGVSASYSVDFIPGAGGSMIPTGIHSYGGVIAISATPDITHTFSQWTATGPITFDNVNAASTNAHINGAGSITANFNAIQYSVNFVLGPGGSTINPAEGSHAYDVGSSVPISAVADGTHSFSQWTSDTASITFDDANVASTNAHISGPGTITANFALIQYDVQFFMGSGGQSINPAVGVHPFGIGASVPISAVADANSRFSQWTATGSITFDDASLASTNAHINGAGSITANFVPLQQATFVSAGTASNAGGPNGNPTPGYPSGMQANDLILLQVVVRGDPATTVTPPAGFNLLYGPDATGGTTARVTQWIYWKFATGTESGTPTVTVSQTSGIYGRGATMYAFRNVALNSFAEGANITTGNSASVLAPSVTTSGVKRLAVSFEVVAGDASDLNSFTGESGGDWTLVSPYNVYHGTSGDHHFENGLQTATMASQGKISGGSDGIAAYYWIVRSFALLPR